MREKREKITQNEKMFYITLCVGSKREPFAFFSRFSRVCAHKHYQNANQTHSVIWALNLDFFFIKGLNFN